MAHAARALRLGVMLGCMLDPGSGLPPAAASRRSATTSISTATCCSAKTRGRGWSFGTESKSRLSRAGSASPPMTRARILVLGEGFSGDPHYGKTMRGIIRYGPDRSSRSSTRPARGGERGDPVVETVADALPLRADAWPSWGSSTSGGTVPAGMARAPEGAIAAGLDVESGLHEFISDDPELVELAATHDVELRDLRKPPAGLNVPTGANLDRREDRADRRLRLRDRKEDGRDRARSDARGAVSSRCSSRRGRPVSRSRLGDRRGRGGLRLPRRRGGVARRRGRGARWEAALRRGSGLARPSALLGRDARVHPRLDATCVRPLSRAGATEIEGCPGHRDSALADLVELHERMALPARKANVACIAVNTAGLSDRALAPRFRGRRGNRASRGRSRPLRRRSICLTRSSPDSRLRAAAGSGEPVMGELGCGSSLPQRLSSWRS